MITNTITCTPEVKPSNSVLTPDNLLAALNRRKPGARIEAHSLTHWAWLYTSDTCQALRDSLTSTCQDRAKEPNRAVFNKGKTIQGVSARVYTESELEAAKWLKDKELKRIKPARRGSRLARMLVRKW